MATPRSAAKPAAAVRSKPRSKPRASGDDNAFGDFMQLALGVAVAAWLVDGRATSAKYE